MPTRHGSNLITGVRFGSNVISSVRLGSLPVWSASGLLDTFNRPDAANPGASWTDEGHSSGGYLIGIQDQVARLAIPDGVFGFSNVVEFARMRYNAAQHPSDDGYIEARLATRGGGSHATDVFRRLTNTGYTHGVGMRFVASSVSILRRVAGTDNEMAAGGSFEPGDTARLIQAGNLHGLFVNGSFRVLWDDSAGTASSGAGFRSMGATMRGSVPDLFNPRRFSPALDYIECS